MGDQKQVKPTQVDPLRPEFRGLSSDLGSYARTLVGRGATPYTGSFTAPMSGGETDILARINAFNPTGAGGADRTNLISDILSGRRLNPASNPFLDATINDITRRSNESLGGNLNMVDTAFGRSGMFGPSSGRSEQAIEASRRSAGDLNGTIAGILGANYQQGLQEQMQTLSSILPGMDAQSSQFLFSALGANALPRTIQQNDLGMQYQEFLRQLQEPMQYTQLASQILGSQPGFQYANQQYAPMPFWQQALLGGISGGAAGYASTL